MPRSPKKFSRFDACLGAVLRMNRSRLDVSQEEVSALSGIPLSNYKRREQGKAEVTVSELERIASALNTSSGEIVRDALRDYGGLSRLIDEHTAVSEGDGTVAAEDNVTYIGHYNPGMRHAAETSPRVPPKE